MITYYIWQNAIENINPYLNTLEQMSEYAFGAFLSVFTLSADIVTLPFQLAGIIIYLIIRRKK